MTTIVLRSSKLVPLTIAEVDANFQNLNTDKTENSDADITGGKINGTVIGNEAAAAGNFTTLSTTSDLTTTDLNFNLGYNGTSSSTINISGGAVASGNIKTLNIGTGGAAGSQTNLNLGSTEGGIVTVENDLVVNGNASVTSLPTTSTNLTNKAYVDNILNKSIGIAVALG